MRQAKIAFAIRACLRALHVFETTGAESAILRIAAEVNQTMQRMHEAKTNPRKIALAEKKKR